MKTTKSIALAIGAAVVIVGASWLAAHVWSGGQSDYRVRETKVMAMCVGISFYACLCFAYHLFQSVISRRTSSVVAGSFFAAGSLVGVFIPQILMRAAQALSPGLYRGDSGWNFFVAPLLTAPFVFGLLMMFITALVVQHVRRNNEPPDKAAQPLSAGVVANRAAPEK